MIEIITADITELKVDAIVNAANCSLLGGGGRVSCHDTWYRDGREIFERKWGFRSGGWRRRVMNRF